MSRMIQIRHVPEGLHKRLKSRAATAGMSLSDYLRSELEQVAGKMTPAEMRARLDALPRTTVRESVVDAVRAEREGR